PAHRRRGLHGTRPGGHPSRRLDDRSSLDRGPAGHGRAQGPGVNVPAAEVERLLHDLAPRAVAILTRRCGDFAAAEDAVQDALIAAAAQWTGEGLPDTPCAWLVHVAQRRLTDQLRSEIARRRREAAVAAEQPPTAKHPIEGDGRTERETAARPRLLVSHPAL